MSKSAPQTANATLLAKHGDSANNKGVRTCWPRGALARPLSSLTYSLSVHYTSDGTDLNSFFVFNPLKSNDIALLYISLYN